MGACPGTYQFRGPRPYPRAGVIPQHRDRARQDNTAGAAHMLPNSPLVASDSWGHEAVGTSACVDDTLWD
jgi:hypothetical protein